MPLLVRQDDLLMRLVKDVNDIRSALKRTVANLPLFDIANENTPEQLTSNQNDYVPGNYDKLMLSSNSPVTITGMRGGVKGRTIQLFNVGLYTINLAHLSGSSLAANQFKFVTGTGNVILPASSILLYYDIRQQKWISGTQLEESSISKEFTASQITVNQDNYDPSDYGVLRLSTDAARTITGFTGGVQGRFLHIFNVGVYEITISHQSGSSLAANRVISPTGFDMVINPNGEITLYYDVAQQRWISSYSSNANRISCQLRRTTDHFLADSDDWDIEWETSVDTGGFWDSGSPTVITIPETGWYSIDLQVIYEAVGSAAGRFTSIRDNTSYLLAIDSRPGIADSVEDIFVHIGKSAIYRLKGSTIIVNVVHLSAAGLNIFATKNGLWTGPAYTEFSIAKL